MLPLSDREKRLGHWILAAFLLIIIAPYVWVWAITPPGYAWGGLIFSTDDQNVHLMWARQAQDGAFFLRDLFTNEGLISGARPLFTNFLVLLMGWMARLTGLEVAIPYHIIRVAGAAWALWQLHLLSWSVTSGAPERENARLWTLALAAFATGAGFVALFFPQVIGPMIWIDRVDNPGWPLMPEAFLLLSALIYPLNIISFGLLALIFRHILDGKAPVAFVGALFLSNIHTYDALPLLGVAALWAVWNWKGDRASSLRALAAIAGATIPVLYQIVVFRDSEEFRIKALTLTEPPPVVVILISFLFLILLAMEGFLRLRDRPQARNLLVLWALVTLAMVYAPISFGRKMLEGFQLPLLVLAGVGLSALKRPFLAGLIVVLMALSPLQTFGWILNNAAENNAWRVEKFLMPPVYLHNSEVAALSFINKDPAPGAVLCLPISGAYVPRATGKFTYAGHWAETLNLKTEKLPQTLRYFGGQMAPAQARSFLADNRIRWIFEGPYERSLNPNSASRALGLRELFRAGEGANETVVYGAS